MPTKTFKIAGLTCIDCAARVRATVSRVEGVDDCQVDHAIGTLIVSFAEPDVATEKIARAVSAAGHTLVTEDTDKGESNRHRENRPLLGFARFVFSKRETTLAAVAGLLTLLGLALTAIYSPPTLGGLGGAVPPTLGGMGWAALFAAAIVVGGIPVTRHAFQELWLSRSLGINTLMVIAVVGAAFIGEWAEAAIVVVLFSLGEALEGYATERARGALDSLLDLAPPVALKIMPTGETQEVPVERLAVADRVLVRPGDRVSVDGIVRAGQSAVDQAPITGESVPVDKKPGDEVFAGTINTSGALEVEVTHLAADNTLSRMHALVQQAQSRQAPVQRFIDRFARVYT
ncbi:MAG: cation-translocating P-type ATPase, partial [Anaerolineae bacterium]|nr:cation-translocating P-type ATPase [Anaerolineae bacterium]